MLWDPPHRRAAGFAVDVLRSAWIYGILVTLAEIMHLHPAEVHTLLARVNECNTPIIGHQPLNYDTIARKVAGLHNVGLVARSEEREIAHGARTVYDVTPLGAGLLNSLGSLGDWAVDHPEHLVRTTRVRHGLDPRAPLPSWLKRPEQHARHVLTRLAIGLLDSRWAFTILVHCSSGLAQPSALLDRINTRIASQPDLAGRRRLTTKPLYDTLQQLRQAGLVDQQIRLRPARPANVLYEPTDLGRGLLDALWPVAQWGVGHDQDLYRILASRYGWTNATSTAVSA